MKKAAFDSLKREVLPLINGRFYLTDNGDGTFTSEIYADYRDEMSDKDAFEICESDDPEFTLYEKLEAWYMPVADYEWDEICKGIKEALEENCQHPEGLTAEEEDIVEDLVRETVYFSYPADHYMKQKFYVNIMLDTGDGNYDYTLNSPYPCWYGRYGDRLDEKSSLLWLARQQGYTKTQLWRALRKGDVADPKGFLDTCRQELANLPSHMATLTFLVRMTLRELIELNRCIKLQDRNGHFYDATKNPYCGYIVLGKETMTGLFDPWGGGGSVLEIELEKDVRIPIRFIRSALPDGCDGYGVGDVYGMCGSAWKESLKEVHPPKNVRNSL